MLPSAISSPEIMVSTSGLINRMVSIDGRFGHGWRRISLTVLNQLGRCDQGAVQFTGRKRLARTGDADIDIVGASDELHHQDRQEEKKQHSEDCFFDVLFPDGCGLHSHDFSVPIYAPLTGAIH